MPDKTPDKEHLDAMLADLKARHTTAFIGYISDDEEVVAELTNATVVIETVSHIYQDGRTLKLTQFQISTDQPWVEYTRDGQKIK